MLWVTGALPVQVLAAEFVDEFEHRDPAAAGWTSTTGDGAANMRFTSAGGTARIEVDARNDERNIWWAFIRHAVTPAIDAAELARPDRELRIDARVRTDTAPRRINLHANHTGTTDFHSHLMEYDLPAANEWFDISMTTRDFDARADDEVFVQLALMDWGLQVYQLEIDYLRVQVVDPDNAGPDRGRPLPYRPSVPPPASFAHAVPVAVAATVERPTRDLGGEWRPTNGGAGEQLTAAPSKYILLAWDFTGIVGRRVPNWGVLALHTTSAQESGSDLESFDELRVAEILARDAGNAGADADVDWSSIVNLPETAVINEQPLIDVRAAAPGATTIVPISPPALERLIDGRSAGLAILSHGGVVAGFSADGEHAPALHFDTAPAKPNETQEGPVDHDR